MIKKIIIIQRTLPHYRKPFFENLKKRLEKEGILLVLIYGKPTRSEEKKRDISEIEWAHKIRNLEIKIGSRYIIWQPCLKFLKGADLIIVEQASKLLINYLIFAGQILGFKKMCFWGHGKNFQAKDLKSGSEAVKFFMSRYVHWWFAYNDLSANIVKALGYPENRITSVKNTIDIIPLIEAMQNINKKQLELIKQKNGIKVENICIYSGGMYPEKRLDFLIEACVLIKQRIPDFEIIFIGAGPDDEKVKKASIKYQWIHYIGPMFGTDKVPFFMFSKLCLMPGAVGLVILDAFALETPLITTNITYHGPEIDYLVDGINGIIVQETEDPNSYAEQVAYLLQDKDALDKLKEGCRIAKTKYTMNEMVERFASGIIQALKT